MVQEMKMPAPGGGQTKRKVFSTNDYAAIGDSRQPSPAGYGKDDYYQSVTFCSGYGQYYSAETGSTERRRSYEGITWPSILGMMERPQSVPKERAQWAIFSTLPSRTFEEQRRYGNFHVAWIDLDKNPPPVSEAAGCIAKLVCADAYTYTTRSARQKEQKSRTLIPLAKPIDGRRFELLQECINDRLEAMGITPDRAAERAAQLCYLPNLGEFYDTSSIDFLGPLDWEAQFGEEMARKEQELAAHEEAHRRHQEEAARRREQRQYRQELTGERSPIDAYNAEHSLRELWESFGARWHGRRGQSPHSTSGTYGITLSSDDQHWHSFHESDVEAGIGRADASSGGCWGDAFDLFVHFEHDGDRHAALRAAGEMFEVEPGVSLTKHNQRAYRQAQAWSEAEEEFARHVRDAGNSGQEAPVARRQASADAHLLARSIHQRVLEALGLGESDERAGALSPDPRVIDAMLNSAFWSGSQGKVFMLNESQALNRYLERDAYKFLMRRFGPVLDQKAVESLAGEVEAEGRPRAQEDKKRRQKLVSDVLAILGGAILDHLKYHNQRDSIEWRVDMFASTSRLVLMEDKARIVLAHRPFEARGPHDRRVVEDYKEHFPRFDIFLEFLVMSRFSADRKKSYLWIQASSDWGKGFLLGVLSSIDAAVGTSVKEVEAMFEGRPVGRTPEEFKRSLVLVIDEFKTVKSELKQLQSEIALAPKNQLTAKVEIFAKLLFSAESVASLVTENGVEDQFANRMSIFQESGSIESRPLFNELGKGRYRRAVTAYAADELNRMIEEMQHLGREEAEAKADCWINQFIGQYGLDTVFDRFSNSLVGVADDFADWLGRSSVSDYLLFDVPSETSFLAHPRKVLDTFLETTFDKSEVGAYYKRKEEILGHLSADGRGSASHRINGISKKAVKLRLGVIPERRPGGWCG